MKKYLQAFFLIFISLSSLQAYAIENNQEKAIEKLLSVKTMNISRISDIYSLNYSTNEHSFTGDGLSYQVINGSNEELQHKALPKKIETYSTMINVVDGFIFHVADYYGAWGNSRIVTCLNGGLRGLQSIFDNGILMIQSTDVKWHKTHIEHKYPAGKVYTYENKQILKLK